MAICIFCHKDTAVKNGFYKHKGIKKQRYYCKNCKVNFTDSKHHRNYPLEYKIKVVLHSIKVSIADAARTYKHSETTVRKWRKEFKELAEKENLKLIDYLKKRLKLLGKN